MNPYGILILMVVHQVAGFPTHRQEIPNGHKVLHPCQPDTIWKGVGHQNMLGSGPLNPFGIDFDSEGNV